MSEIVISNENVAIERRTETLRLPELNNLKICNVNVRPLFLTLKTNFLVNNFIKYSDIVILYHDILNVA